MMNELILYHQPECHLCDEAEALLQTMGLAERYRKVDIETDLELLKRYGIHVPVLRRDDKESELFWPFNELQVSRFLGIRK